MAKGNIQTFICDPASNGFSATVNETDYVLDQDGHQVTEMTSDGNANGSLAWAHTNVWAGEQLLATYSAVTDANNQGDGALHFYLNDWVGTRRVQTDYAGIQEQDCSSLPFGDQLNCTQSIDGPTEHHFTGKERDTESGNDYFGARYYSSTMGRFLSPDWSAKEEPVPYAKLDNPQTLNLYQYTRNNPLGVVDSDGHQEAPPEPKDESDAWDDRLADLIRDFQDFQRAQERLSENMQPVPTSGIPEIPVTMDPLLSRYLSGNGGRWGGISTRELNDKIASTLEAEGFKITNGAGRAKEEWIPGPGGSLKGGTWVDITATKDGQTIRIQTITTLSDGKTPIPEEAAAAARIRQAFPNDTLVLIPKK